MTSTWMEKVCGILSEAVSDMESGRISHIIIGIGLNFSVPQNHFPADLQEKPPLSFLMDKRVSQGIS